MPDVKKFMGSLKFKSDSEREAVLSALGEGENAQVIDRLLANQEDYDSKMAELQTERQRLEQDYQSRVQKEEEFHQSMVDWQGDEQQKLEEAVSAREQAEARLESINSRIRKLAQDHEIPEEEIRELVTSGGTPSWPVRPERANDSRGRESKPQYVTREEISSEGRAFARLPGIMLSIDREHRRLFGEEAMPDWEKILTQAERNHRSVQKEWEAQYAVEAKRREVTDAAHAREIQEAEQRGAERARSSFLAENPAAAAAVRERERPGSPLLGVARKESEAKAATAPPPASEPDRRRGIQAAVQAYQAAKYKDGKEQTAA